MKYVMYIYEILYVYIWNMLCIYMKYFMYIYIKYFMYIHEIRYIYRWNTLYAKKPAFSICFSASWICLESSKYDLLLLIADIELHVFDCIVSDKITCQWHVYCWCQNFMSVIDIRKMYHYCIFNDKMSRYLANIIYIYIKNLADWTTSLYGPPVDYIGRFFLYVFLFTYIIC